MESENGYGGRFSKNGNGGLENAGCNYESGGCYVENGGSNSGEMAVVINRMAVVIQRIAIIKPGLSPQLHLVREAENSQETSFECSNQTNRKTTKNVLNLRELRLCD